MNSTTTILTEEILDRAKLFSVSPPILPGDVVVFAHPDTIASLEQGSETALYVESVKVILAPNENLPRLNDEGKPYFFCWGVQ